jgi:uncharacterized membrane-anchored protein YhcB (DUF1043 family)
MKKSYIIFALLLVVLVVGYLLVRNYIGVQAQEAQLRDTKQMIASELDKFKVTVDSHIDESEQALLMKLDSLTDTQNESADLMAGLDSLGVDSTYADSTRVDSVSANEETATAAGDSLASSDSTESRVPSEQDNEIYIRYLKKRWALPSDLTKYELAVAKQEIMTEVGKDYGLNADEILSIIDKVYLYRKSLKNENSE